VILPQSNQLGEQSALFHGLTNSDRERLLQVAASRRVQSNGFFFHQGEPAIACYVLVEGEVKLTQVTVDGHQMLVRFVTSGGTFGIIAILPDSVYTLSAQAAHDCTALQWEGRVLTQTAKQSPQIALNALGLVTEHFRQTLDRYQEVVNERVERRLARLLLRLARQLAQKTEHGLLIDLPLSREDMADMTGTTLYTVSRILSRWERQGYLETGKRQLLIHSPHAFVAIAEDLPSDIAPAQSPQDNPDV
jgi:CRP/FNR family transcriptional regulator, nitrogen oxide reductase regulator